MLDAAAATLPALQACFYVLMCQFFCGILLGYVFMQSHNGMEIYSDGRDFVTSQLASTRNIHGGVFNDWRAPALACMIPTQPQRQTAEPRVGACAGSPAA